PASTLPHFAHSLTERTAQTAYICMARVASPPTAIAPVTTGSMLCLPRRQHCRRRAVLLSALLVCQAVAQGQRIILHCRRRVARRLTPGQSHPEHCRRE